MCLGLDVPRKVGTACDDIIPIDSIYSHSHRYPINQVNMWTQLYLISMDLRALLPFSWSGTRLKVEVILPIRRKLNEYGIVEECIRSIHIMAAKGLGIRSNAHISPKPRGILKLVHFSHCTPARCSLLWKVRRANGAALSLTGQVGSYGLSSKWLGFGWDPESTCQLLYWKV